MMRHPFRSVRIFLISKKWAAAGVCLTLAALMFCLVNYPSAVGASAATRQLPIYCVQRDQKLVAISFDAAWGDVKVRQRISRRSLFHFMKTIHKAIFINAKQGCLNRFTGND